MSKARSALLIYLKLTKLPLSFLIALSAYLGFLVDGSLIDPKGWIGTLAIFLLSKSAATLNNVQDINLDKNLERTKNRPLPSGKVHWSRALALSITLLSLSFSLFYYINASTYLFLMATISIVVYNVVYTYSKRVSTASIFPGAVCGMLPPYLGWLIHNLGYLNFSIFVVTMVLFVWQFPHFWLITRFNERDYGRENPTLPAMLKIFNSDQFNKIIIVWMLFYATITLFLPVTSTLDQVSSRYMIVVNALFIMLSSLWLYLKMEDNSKFYKKLFMKVNLSLLNIILIFVFDRALLL